MLKVIFIGTDPEILIKNNKEILNAIPYVAQGTKENPLPMDKEGFFFMFDRGTIEWNQPPTSSLEEFKEYIKYAMGYIKELLPNGVEFSSDASVFLSEEQIAIDERCIQTGCSPSYTCYGMEENPSPDIEKFPNLQCTGGHIHLQFEKLSVGDAEKVVRAMDLFLGVASVILDTDLHRRSLYGKAGECRFNFTDNRLEYRTLSNFWLFSEELQEWVWNQIHKAIDYLNSDKDIFAMEGQVKTAIDEGNISIAYELCREFNLLPENKKVEIEC